MALALWPPFAPMEALSVPNIPTDEGWQYEPKWDGFRCLAFRDGDKLELRSKAGQPLGRYFPDMVKAMLELPAKRFVLDGELVVPSGKELNFDLLLLRIHPAESRVLKLAADQPAMFIAFDLLVDDKNKPIFEEPLRLRRPALEKFAARHFSEESPVYLSPATHNPRETQLWLKQLGTGLDGIIAKRLDAIYAPGKRHSAMVKIKHMRTADCIVGGFRYGRATKSVGSLLLGLYDDEGLLQHVGHTSSLNAKEKKELTPKLEKLRGGEGAGFTGHAPGAPSRWRKDDDRSTQWEPLRPELVVEVQYDHFSGQRFRHGTRLLRWRPDKAPEQCLLSQVQQESKSSTLALLA